MYGHDENIPFKLIFFDVILALGIGLMFCILSERKFSLSWQKVDDGKSFTKPFTI